MNVKNQCPNCLKNFSSLQRLTSHLERQSPCKMNNNNSQLDKFICKSCQKEFSRKFCLDRHLKKYPCCVTPVQQFPIKIQLKLNYQPSKDHGDPDLKNKLQFLEKQIAEQNEKIANQSEKIANQSEKIAKLTEKPSNVINNNLQIICIGNNDNYLDMLTEKWSNFDRALEYIKDCALSNLTGDCKLIEKIYLEEQTQTRFPSIRLIGKNRTKIEYFNENKEMVVDSKELFGKKLANNLQNSYLKGVNYLIIKNLENQRCPNKFLEDYDLQAWNQHIFDLSDMQYQKKIINNLNIPH